MAYATGLVWLLRCAALTLQAGAAGEPGAPTAAPAEPERGASQAGAAGEPGTPTAAPAEPERGASQAGAAGEPGTPTAAPAEPERGASQAGAAGEPGTPTAAPAEPERGASQETPVSPIRFVLANTYGLNFGATPIPSGEATLFLGGSLPLRSWRPSQWLALGYHGALAGGSADAPGFAADTSLFVHRHHLALLGAGGPKGRLAYSVGVGVVLTAPQRAVPGLEAEGRLGYLFGRPEHRNQGIVGAQLRISGSLAHSPWPQLGLFVGLVHAPFARRTDGTRMPPNGLGLLVPGAMLVASGVLTAVSSGIALAAHGGSGTDALWSYTAPYSATALALGVPLLAVGAVRVRDYRAYRLRMGRGLAIDF